MKDLLVFVLRAQPCHIEHERIIKIALAKSKNVLVLVGSAGKARSVRNAFTYDERLAFITACFPEEYQSGRLIIHPLYDRTYNDSAWTKQVQDIVHETSLLLNNAGGFNLHGVAGMKIGMIGAEKDHTSYYLKLFPQWKEHSVNVEIKNEIHATSIREGLLSGTLERFHVDTTLLPTPVCDILFGADHLLAKPEFAQLRAELKHVRDYKKQWEAAPYPVKHMTVDSVVEQSGHILLVKRRSEPGKGLWALPGGHLEIDETLLDGALRELKEETKIKIPRAVLLGSIVGSHIFDDPHRSNIGRVITQAYHFKLKDDTKLPVVKGSDDAEKASWVPLTDIREDIMFDDHWHIINYFLGI